MTYDSLEDVTEDLMDITEDVTREGTDSLMLSGDFGHVLLVDPDGNEVVQARKKMLNAFDRCMEEILLDAGYIEEIHGDLSPETTYSEIEQQVEDMFRHDHLKRNFLEHLKEEMGVEGPVEI